MKRLAIALVSMLASAQVVVADVYQVNISGNFSYSVENLYPTEHPNPVDPFNSSVSIYQPTPFTLSFTFDSSAPLYDLQAGANTFTYSSSGTETLDFGNYSLQGTNGELVEVLDGQDSTTYGYNVFSNQGFEINGITFGITSQLQTTEAVNGSTLGSITNVDLADLDNQNGIVLHSDSPYDGLSDPEYLLSGYVRTYSIEDLSVPEPSTWALLLLGGVALLSYWCRRLRNAKIVNCR